MDTGISPHGITYCAYSADELASLDGAAEASLRSLPQRLVAVGIIRLASGCDFARLSTAFENVVVTWSAWHGTRQGQWLHVVAAWTAQARIELPTVAGEHLLIHTKTLGRPDATYAMQPEDEDLVVCPTINPNNSADVSGVKNLVFRRAPSLAVAPLRGDR